MINLPKSTIVNKFIPKEKIADKLNLTTPLKENLKNVVKKFTITNELSPQSMNIVKGKDVAAVFVIEVLLKKHGLDYKLLEYIAKQNPNKILFVINCENSAQLVVVHSKLYHSEWGAVDDLTLDIRGDNFDAVWDNIIRQIAIVKPANSGADIDQELEKQELRSKLTKEIARLEKQARSEQQPKRKFELVGRIGGLKKRLEELV